MHAADQPMRPWRADPSDFASPAPPPSASPARGLAGVGATTLALGFLEACLHLQQRPIPLRFASRFALANAVPSVVWATVAAPTVAAASNLPVERLVASASPHAEPNLDPRRANRIIAIKSVRSLRHAVASYGLVWTLWRWHETTHARAEFAQAHAPSGQVERVVRLAPEGSFLSKATSDKHGDHVVHVAWHAARGASPIDWSAIGLQQASSTKANETSEAEARLRVLELEIDGKNADPFLIAKRTVATAASGKIKTVAVVNVGASPLWQARSNGVDVYFFVLSGVLRFLLDCVTGEKTCKVVLVNADSEDEDTLETSGLDATMQLVRSALIHRHGISSVIGLEFALPSTLEKELPGESEEYQDAMIVVFASTAEAALKQVNDLAGFIPLHRIRVVVQDTVSPANLHPFSKTAGILSMADLADDVFQFVRVQLRAGVSPSAIQRQIFEEFGEQSSLMHRKNAASDITRYI